MNIKKAKNQVKETIRAYLQKDQYGNYMIATARQRPIFLLGAPGIGKTAIMEQIASELDLGLVTYSMTHHTRQSAIGLPCIIHKNYNGNEYSVTEYTMSEIIASVYNMQEEGGVQEGILFLDEINCVSETLAPAMLAFLQFKTFGGHKVPEGWVVVTAGNPPEFNDSVREFDVVTMDRLKLINIDPDFEAWREYASRQNIHNAIVRYLDIKKNHFFTIETTIDGKEYVTARGWEDLSDMLKLYESMGAKVDVDLVAQYMHHPKSPVIFPSTMTCTLSIRLIIILRRSLSVKSVRQCKEKVNGAPFDEKLALLGLLIDAITEEAKSVIDEREVLSDLLPRLKLFGSEIKEKPLDGVKIFGDYLEQQQKRIARLKTLGRTAKETFTHEYRIQDASRAISAFAEQSAAEKCRCCFCYYQTGL